MAEGTYKIGKYTFDNKADYDAALKEVNIIKTIMSKTNVNKKENAKALVKFVREGKITFSSPIGRDFVKRLEEISGEKAHQKISAGAVSQYTNQTVNTITKTASSVSDQIEYTIIGARSSSVSKSTAAMFIMSFVVTLICSFIGIKSFLYPIIVLVELFVGCWFLHETDTNIKKIDNSKAEGDNILEWILPIGMCLPFLIFPFLIIVLIVVQIIEKAKGGEHWFLGNILHGIFFVAIQFLFIVNIRMGQLIALDSFMEIGNIIGRIFVLPLFILLSVLFSCFLAIAMCKLMKSQFSIAIKCAFVYPIEASSCLLMYIAEKKLEYDEKRREEERRNYEAAQRARQAAQAKRDQTPVSVDDSDIAWGDILLGAAVAAAVVIGGIAISSAISGLAPGLVGVSAYTRRNPNGGITYVRSHVRTAPDGILWNNLSYKG